MNRDTRRTRWVLAVLLLLSLTLVAVDSRGGDDSPLAGLRTTAGNVFGPVEGAATTVVAPVADAVDALGRLDDDGTEIDRLRAEIDRLRAEQAATTEDRARVDQMNALLKITAAARYRMVPAVVTGAGARQTFSRTVTIDAGSRDGIARNMTVLNAQGLVGRVVVVSAWSSTVLLINDPISGVGVRFEGQTKAGSVTGRGDDPLQLTIGADAPTPAVGDRLVTLGSQRDSPYVRGVPVGTVTAVDARPGATEKTAQVAPFVDMDSLDLVSVVVEPPRDDPRDVLLAPPPAAGGG